MATINLSEQTYALLQDPLLGDEPIEIKILRLLEGALVRKRDQNHALDQTLAQKYTMSFWDFMERRTSVQYNASWEVENDATEWQDAMADVAAIEEQLVTIRELLPSADEEA